MITPSLVPARTSGVAPLAVYFDASGTTSTQTTRPIHECHYTFDFGDPAGGATWAYGNMGSKNSAYGAPFQAHCFETPGSYTVTLKVFDGVDVGTTTTAITVTDPDTVFSGSTVVISHDGDFTGAPTGDQVTSTDWDSIINTTAGSGATYKRIRIKRGGTYTASASWQISADGPGLIDTWGSGAKPLVQGAVYGQLGASGNYDFGDWRFLDLSFDGVSQTTTACYPFVGGVATVALQLTWLRCEWTNFDVNHDTPLFALDTVNTPSFVAPLWREWAIVASIQHDGLNNGIIIAVNKCMVLGNLLQDVSAGFAMRLVFGQGFVISNNEIGPTSLSELTIRGTPYTAPGATIDGDPTIGDPYTQDGTISDNKFLTSGTTSNCVTFRSTNSGDDERLRNIIFERNWVPAGALTQQMLVIESIEFTARNNLMVLTGATGGAIFQIRKDAGTPTPPDNVDFLNNTIFDGGTSAIGLTVVAVSDSPTNVRVHNNLTWADLNSGTMSITTGAFGAGNVVSNNSTTGQMNGTDPLFVDATPTVPADFQLQATSYGVGAGLTVDNFIDFFQRSRNAVTNTMGFYQYTEGSYPWNAVATTQKSARRVIGLTWTA